MISKSIEPEKLAWLEATSRLSRHLNHLFSDHEIDFGRVKRRRIGGENGPRPVGGALYRVRRVSLTRSDLGWGRRRTACACYECAALQYFGDSQGLLSVRPNMFR